MELTDRQKQVLTAALSYAFSNASDINDVFAHFTDEDEYNEEGKILLSGVVTDSFDEQEFEDVANLFGINLR